MGKHHVKGKSAHVRRSLMGGSVSYHSGLSCDGAVGNLRFKNHVIQAKFKAKLPHPQAKSAEELSVSQSLGAHPQQHSTAATRKKVLEELGNVLAGHKKK